MTAPYAGKATRAVVVAIVALITLASCSSGGSGDSLDQQQQDASDQGYVSGDGSTTSIPPEDRTGVVKFEGVTEWGETVNQNDLVGSVTVVNFWYAGCPHAVPRRQISFPHTKSSWTKELCSLA